MPINDWLSNNSGALLAASAGLLGGRTGNEQAGLGLKGFGDAMTATKQKNRTIEFLQKMNPELAQAVESGALSPLDAYKTHIEAQKPKNNYLTVGKSLFDTDTKQWLAPPAGVGGDDVEAGLNLVYGQDAEGNTVGFQPLKSGGLKRVDVPEGVKLTPGTSAVDLGTSIGIRDNKSGTIIRQVPKDLAGAERQKAVGKSLGEAESTYTSMTSKMPGLEKVVKNLDDLSNKATYTLGGQAVDAAGKQLGMEPRDAAVARAEYIAVVDNQVLPLLRDTFGAQFTQKEGETLRLTLGDPNKSPAEKQAVLKAFIEQKRRDVEALGSQIGAQPTQGVGKTKSGVSWSIE